MTDLAALLSLAQCAAKNAVRSIEKDIINYQKVEQDILLMFLLWPRTFVHLFNYENCLNELFFL